MLTWWGTVQQHPGALFEFSMSELVGQANLPDFSLCRPPVRSTKCALRR